VQAGIQTNGFVDFEFALFEQLCAQYVCMCDVQRKVFRISRRRKAFTFTHRPPGSTAKSTRCVTARMSGCDPVAQLSRWRDRRGAGDGTGSRFGARSISTLGPVKLLQVAPALPHATATIGSERAS